MDGETTSWIRRANFSHTVCYRMITTKSLESNTPFVVNKEKTFGFERLPLTSPLDLKPLMVATPQQPMGLNVAERCVVGSEIQRNHVTNKKRSVSPSPHIALPDSFQEAKSNIKRFSTPHPIRMEPEKGTKLSRKYSFEKISSNLRSLSHSTPIKERSKSSKKDKMSSLKSSDYGGSRVSSIGMGALEEHLIDTCHVSYGDMFAKAIHSQLFLGEYKGKEVALKIIKANDDSEGDPILGARLEKQFIKEATLLSRLSHPNVVKFVGVNSGNCIIMEYLPKGSLRSYLHKLERKSLPLQQLIKFGLDIARGMEYIHSREIVHRDLKPGNVLIDQNFGLKIADFGIACEEEYCCNSFGDNTGTFRWMAPEVIRRRPHGRKADVYSFGLVLWEMVAGAIPYEDLTPVQAAFAVVHKNIRPMIPNDCPVAIKDMIEQCWTVEADKRPEFWQIVKVLEQFEKSLKSEGKLVLSPSQICPELKKTTKHWIRIFGLANHHHHHGGNNNTKRFNAKFV